MKMPLLADMSHKIARDYGCLIEEGPDAGIAFRATYIIDGNGVLRHMSIQDLPVGRNADETFRLIQAFQHADSNGVVCPASWVPGAKTIIPDQLKMK